MEGEAFAGVHKYLETLDKAREQEEKEEQERTLPQHKVSTSPSRQGCTPYPLCVCVGSIRATLKPQTR